MASAPIDRVDPCATIESMNDRADVRVIPPLIPLAALAAGFALHHVHPIPIGPAPLTAALGGVVLVISIAMVVAAVWELRRAETAFDVRRSTTQLVDRGVFALSRNPVYLSAILLCWAVGLLANAAWVALLAIPAASGLCLAVIRREEAYLERKFGEPYRDYCSQVRRWI